MQWYSPKIEQLYPSGKVTNSGSISTLPVTDEVKERPPLGFCPPSPREPWGEAEWTAADLL